MKFPPYLIGKRVALGVNLIGDRRVGEVLFETLNYRVKRPERIYLEENGGEPIEATRTFELDVASSEPINIYNAEVNCSIELDNMEILSLEQNHYIERYEDCRELGAKAFIKVKAQLIELNSSGSIDFNDCHISTFDKF